MDMSVSQQHLPPAIQTRGLTKQYTTNGQPLTAVDSLDLSIPAGSVYALLGPNGAGKSTTIGMLTTLIAPTAGSARVAGYDLVREGDQVRAHIGVTFQELVLDKELTGRRVLDIHGRLYRLPGELRRQRLEHLVRLAALEEAIDRPVASYSGGMKRRLELIRGLLTGPQVLFLDEPTQGLDPQNRAVIWDYLQTLMQAGGLTILLTTHAMDEAEALADRVGIIDHGRLLVEGRPAELVAGMGADVLSIRGRGALDPLVPTLQAQPFVQSVLVEPQGDSALLQVGVDQGNRRLAESISLAQQFGFQIEEVAIARPSLGDVFLKYTGRALREP
jgi:ABC-2 type transport system ATP-binding protein